MSTKEIVAIFDFDDSLVQSVEAFSRVFRDEGWVVDQSIPYTERWDKLMGVSPEVVHARSNQLWSMPGFHEYFTPADGAIEVVRAIHEHGLWGRAVECYVGTSRPSVSEPATRATMEEYFPGMFKGLFFNGSYDQPPQPHHYAHTKAGMYAAAGAGIVFDDDIKHINGAQEVGVPHIVHTDIRRLYENTPLPDGVLRVHRWGDVLDGLVARVA